MDRIERIGPRTPEWRLHGVDPDPDDGAEQRRAQAEARRRREKRERERAQDRRPPEDDGQPHVDVRA
jgi:hypothetical protein